MKKKFFFCAFLLFSQSFLSFGQVKITFKTGEIPPLKNGAQHLYLAGDFNRWNPADKDWELLPGQAGSYLLSKTLPAGSCNFKVTRGSWQTVECSATGKSVDNRVLRVVNDSTVYINIAAWQDNFANAEKKHTASAQVHVISDKFEMPQLGRQRRIWIYIPAGYQQSGKKYPVIYMHDGQNLFDAYTSGFGEWGIDEILDKLPARDESIIVGIDHGGEYRITEYDAYDSKYGKGSGGDYTEFLVKTLKPYIDKQYRTKTDARHTTIAGSSMGGLISMYAAIKYPGVFGNAGIFSPAFWIAPEIYDFAKQKDLKRSRFYFVCGDAESDSMVSDMKKMAGIVTARGVKPENAPFVIIREAKHNEKQWNGDFPDFYKWLMGGPKVRKSGSPKE